jgi:hypothetical protein
MLADTGSGDTWAPSTYVNNQYICLRTLLTIPSECTECGDHPGVGLDVSNTFSESATRSGSNHTVIADRSTGRGDRAGILHHLRIWICLWLRML